MWHYQTAQIICTRQTISNSSPPISHSSVPSRRRLRQLRELCIKQRRLRIRDYGLPLAAWCGIPTELSSRHCGVVMRRSCWKIPSDAPRALQELTSVTCLHFPIHTGREIRTTCHPRIPTCDALRMTSGLPSIVSSSRASVVSYANLVRRSTPARVREIESVSRSVDRSSLSRRRFSILDDDCRRWIVVPRQARRDCRKHNVKRLGSGHGAPNV